MSKFTIKGIGLLTVLSLLPSSKAVAESPWKYGIKTGVSVSFSDPPTIKQGETINYFNPWIGGSVYGEYVFNDYVGVGGEVLYNRFTHSSAIGIEKDIRVVDTIGVPVTFVLHWTTFLRPDFKEDYFLGRFFLGLHPFYCLKDRCKQKFSNKAKQAIYWNPTHEADDSKFKLGLIAGKSFELPSGFLIELKGMFPYNLYKHKVKKERDFVASFHISVGYNLVKLIEKVNKVHITYE